MTLWSRVALGEGEICASPLVIEAWSTRDALSFTALVTGAAGLVRACQPGFGRSQLRINLRSACHLRGRRMCLKFDLAVHVDPSPSGIALGFVCMAFREIMPSMVCVSRGIDSFPWQICCIYA